MASGAAALALNAAVVAAVLAVLVLPSLGRCPSLGPEPPAPVPAPTPSPGPAISCDDCRSQCYSSCNVSVPLQCSTSKYCGTEDCDLCKADLIKVIKQCEADCCSNGTCGTCNCDRGEEGRCAVPCSGRDCRACLQGEGERCKDKCNSDCNATCV